MTINGTVNKLGILLLILIATATYPWSVIMQNPEEFNPTWMIVGGIGALIVGLVTVFKKNLAMYTAPLYAALEGLLLGSLSAFFEMRFPGIVMQAMMGTIGVLGMLFFLYKTGIIRATENFKLGVAAATGAIMLLYLVSFVLGFFNIHIPYIHEDGWIGIGFSAFVVTIAALNLVMDFDYIENGESSGAPKYLEWFGAFALIVTLVWLYIEILHLLAKIRSRD
jgi:uncharacterized YccA/Bax inhibitor family protein